MLRRSAQSLDTHRIMQKVQNVLALIIIATATASADDVPLCSELKIDPEFESLDTPHYPRRTGVGGEGFAVLTFTIQIDGSITDAKVVKSMPPQFFDRTSIDAIYRSRFKPISQPCRHQHKFEFKLVD